MILNCAIVDDEPLALELLEAYVQKTDFLNLVGKYTSALAAMKDVVSKNIDILFLDIQMPDLNGLDFANMVDSHTRIVFTSAFNQYAADAFRVNALDYIMKPISYKDFLESANKGLKWFELVARANNSGSETTQPSIDEIDSDGLFIKSDYKLMHIKYDDIIYIEGLKDYIKIYTETSQKPILSLRSMKVMEEKLPTSKFIRIHRSYIINKSKITVIDRGRVAFGDKFLPISESYKPMLQNYFSKYSI